MTGVNKSSSLFLRKVRNQVLKNKKIEYSFNCNIFERIDYYKYAALNDFYDTIQAKWNPHRRYDIFVSFYGPKEYPWENDTKCQFIFDYDGEYDFVFVLPEVWLRQYDPTTPVFFHGGSANYFEIEQQRCTSDSVFLMRGTFFPYRKNPSYHPQYPSIYTHRKCDEDWCVTYLNIPNSGDGEDFAYIFDSVLLIESVDFSILDAKIESGEFECSNYCCNLLTIKEKPEIEIEDRSCGGWGKPICLCIKCRGDYRAAKVYVGCGRDRISITVITFYTIDAPYLEVCRSGLNYNKRHNCNCHD